MRSRVVNSYPVSFKSFRIGAKKRIKLCKINLSQNDLCLISPDQNSEDFFPPLLCFFFPSPGKKTFRIYFKFMSGDAASGFYILNGPFPSTQIWCFYVVLSRCLLLSWNNFLQRFMMFSCCFFRFLFFGIFFNEDIPIPLFRKFR